MLEKPDISVEALATLLSRQWQIEVCRLQFLPLGADVQSAVFEAIGTDDQRCFVKLRSGKPDQATVRVPAFLHRAGAETVIPPMKTVDKALWAGFDPFMVTVQQFVDGESGFEREMTGANWVELGSSLRRIHDTHVPEDLRALLGVESYSRVWRDQVRAFQARAESEAFDDPVAAHVVCLLREHRQVIDRLVVRAESLAGCLENRGCEVVLCHGDLHAGNVLIDPEGRLHIVDWDTVILAPRERDLMFIGGGIGGVWKSVAETDQFFRGYGAVEIDNELLAYYRIERVVQDIAEFCEQLLVTDPLREEDRVQSLGYFSRKFEPGGVLEIALETDARMMS
jgi:spectinomycin phosphotransferase